MKLVVATILVTNLAAAIAAPGPLQARDLEQSDVRIFSRGDGGGDLKRGSGSTTVGPSILLHPKTSSKSSSDPGTVKLSVKFADGIKSSSDKKSASLSTEAEAKKPKDKTQAIDLESYHADLWEVGHRGNPS